LVSAKDNVTHHHRRVNGRFTGNPRRVSWFSLLIPEDEVGDKWNRISVGWTSPCSQGKSCKQSRPVNIHGWHDVIS